MVERNSPGPQCAQNVDNLNTIGRAEDFWNISSLVWGIVGKAHRRNYENCLTVSATIIHLTPLFFRAIKIKKNKYDETCSMHDENTVLSRNARPFGWKVVFLVWISDKYGVKLQNYWTSSRYTKSFKENSVLWGVWFYYSFFLKMPDLMRPVYYIELHVASIYRGPLQFLTQGLHWFHIFIFIFIFIPCKKLRHKVKQPTTCTSVFCF